MTSVGVRELKQRRREVLRRVHHVPMDHAWKRHRNWLPAGQALTRLPSEWFAECIYTTFQDDWVAFAAST